MLDVAVSYAELKKALPTLKKGQGKSYMPITSQVLITCDDVMRVNFRTTSYDTFVEYEFESTQIPGSDGMIEPGSVVIPFAALEQVVKNAEKGTSAIGFVETDEAVIIKCGELHTTVTDEFDPTSFPPFPQKKEELFTVDAETLLKARDTVSFAVSKDDTRPALTGIHMSLSESEEHLITDIRLEACDGFRAARSWCKGNFIDDGEEVKTRSIVVPGLEIVPAGLDWLLVSTDLIDYTGKKSMLILESRVGFGTSFSGTSFKVALKVLEDSYPNLDVVIPKDYKNHTFTIDAEKLKKGLKLVSASDKTRHIELTVENDWLRLHGNTSEKTYGKTDWKLYEDRLGSFIPVTFQSQYVLEALEKIGSGSVTISAAKENSPLIVIGNDQTHIIMPVWRT